MPADYERKQTLVGAERFTTPALKELERKILGAESGLKELELQTLHHAACAILRRIPRRFSKPPRAVGEFDALLSLATVARRRGYVRPRMNSGLRALDPRRTPSGARSRR